MKNLENSCLRVGLVPLDKKSRSRAEFAPESQTKIIMTSVSVSVKIWNGKCNRTKELR